MIASISIAVLIAVQPIIEITKWLHTSAGYYDLSISEVNTTM